MSLAGFNAIRKKQTQAILLEEMVNIENKNVEDMTFIELKKYSKSKGIKLDKNFKKEEIISMLIEK